MKEGQGNSEMGGGKEDQCLSLQIQIFSQKNLEKKIYECWESENCFPKISPCEHTPWKTSFTPEYRGLLTQSDISSILIIFLILGEAFFNFPCDQWCW